MKSGTFMDIVSVHYTEIKSLFKTRSYNNGIKFDEDLFTDAFIKCAHKFGSEIISYDVSVKYFWIAYLNTVKTEFNKQNKLDIVPLDEELHDCIDEDPHAHAINIYNIVMDAIAEKFGEENMAIYSLYKYHGWSINDLMGEGYDCTELNSRIKEIHKFVKSYCKTHVKSL
jgi:hypothetical protein